MEEADMKKERQESNPQSCNRADVLGEYARRIKDGEKVGITELLQSVVVSGIMKLERDLYLQQVQGRVAAMLQTAFTLLSHAAAVHRQAGSQGTSRKARERKSSGRPSFRQSG